MYVLQRVFDVDIEWGDGGAIKTSDSTLYNLINDFLMSYKGFVVGVLGFSTLLMVGIGVYLLISLGSGSTNFANKNMNMKKMGTWGICMALMGSLDLFICLIYNSFR